MKKEVKKYHLKVFVIFSIFLIVFTYIYSHAIQIAIPIDKAVNESTSENLKMLLTYVLGLMAISLLALNIAFRIVKNPGNQ